MTTTVAIVLATLAGMALLALLHPPVRRLFATALVGVKWALLWVLDFSGLRARLLDERGVAHRVLTRPRLLRAAFEDLGATYVKLGQIIASSPGLFSAAYVAEFRKVLDHVRPITFEQVQRVVSDELGAAAAQLTIDPQPLASASIAQVHAARHRDGRELVLKVQRPNIAERVEADMAIMLVIARSANRAIKSIRLANPVGVVLDFRETIRQELDFKHEGENNEEFNRIMKERGHARVCAPHVHWDLTTKRVLAMERLYGVNVDDVDAILRSDRDAEELLLLGMRAWFQSVMLYGFFHGDVHAGNLMWLDDGRIGFLDFGIVGRFSDEQRVLVTRYIIAMATGQYHDLAAVVMEMGSVPEDVDIDALAADMKEAYGPLRGLSMGEINYGEILPNILAMSRRHRVRLPQEFILIIKQVLYFDRYAKLLAPDLNIFTDPRMMGMLLADVQQALAAAGG